MHDKRRHLRLVPTPSTDFTPHPAPHDLPDSVRTFLLHLDVAVADWLANSEHEVARQLRRLSADLYLVGLALRDYDEICNRFMICVELAAEFNLHRGHRFSSEGRKLFAMLAITLAERSWLETSLTERAATLRALRDQISNGEPAYEALVQEYAEGLRDARLTGAFDLSLNVRHSLGLS